MLRYTATEIEEVRLALANEKSAGVYKRLQVLLWRMEGVSKQETALRSGFSQPTVLRICCRYKAEGLKGLRPKYKGGKNRKLSKEDEAKALEALAEKAKTGQFVRVSQLQAEFEKNTGVSYHAHVFYRVLERNDWRSVTPRSRHPKAADEATCEASKKLTQK